MTVNLTEKAAFRIRTFLRSVEGTRPGIRVGVKDGGCSGYEYVMDIISEPNKDDLVFEQDRVPIYVDPVSAPLIDGVIVDFAESLTQSGFIFENPNATDGCGCGKSFSVGDCTPEAVPCS
jgi:iron-sulfur cluster assembly protein